MGIDRRRYELEKKKSPKSEWSKTNASSLRCQSPLFLSLIVSGFVFTVFNRRNLLLLSIEERRGATLNLLSGVLPLRIFSSSMSASKWRYSENPPKHITSGEMINPSDTKGSLGKHSASPQRRTSGSHENSAEHSPLHRHHHRRVENKVGGFSPSWEIRGSSEGGHGVASNTPARSPLKVSSRPNESQGGIAVPKFGDWDENNPSSGEAFTDLFNKVSAEKQDSAAKVPMIIDDSIYLNNYHHDTDSKKSTKCCCFNWGKK